MCPSIGSQSGIGAILAMDSPDASSRERSVGPPVIWRKEAEKRVDGGEREAFFSAESRMKIVGFAIHRYSGSECPGAAKGGCCLSRNGSELAAPGAVIAW